VIEKADAGMDVGAAAAVKVELHVDPGFARLSRQLGGTMALCLGHWQ
jgi:hypothetical protein